MKARRQLPYRARSGSTGLRELMFQQDDRRRQPEPLGRSGNVALTPRSAGASFGPDIPTCGRKENLIVPRSADLGKGLRQARRRGRTPRTRSSGILASAGSACR
jgi:hypothetical protein